MFYSSHILDGIVYYLMSRHIVNSHKKYGDNIQVALGFIAYGLNDKYGTISPEILDRDLNFFAQNKIKNVCIFRLGGLNPEYLEIIHKYV